MGRLINFKPTNKQKNQKDILFIKKTLLEKNRVRSNCKLLNYNYDANFVNSYFTIE